MKNCVLSLLLSVSLLSFAQAPASNAQPIPQPPAAQQERPRGEGRGRGQGFGRGVGGAIQAIQGDTVTLTTRDGGTAIVKVGADTRLMRDGKDAKLTDFKVGDRVMVRGESTGTNAWKAEMMGVMPAGGFGGGMGNGGAGGGPNME